VTDLPGWTLPGGPPELGLALGLALLGLGWLCGSFPSAVIVGRLAGVEVLRAGDRNPGSANLWALAGPRAGSAAFCLDLAKVIAPGLAGWAVGGWWGAWVAAMGAVVGAIRPVVPGWRGGRGVNAGAGAAIVIGPPAALIAGGLFLLAWLITRRRVAAITIAFATYPIAFAALVVRSEATAWPMAGVGLLYLLLAGRYAATMPTGPRPAGGDDASREAPRPPPDRRDGA
jgi:glycerol-3-phosphate acyltransferase PlsY